MHISILYHHNCPDGLAAAFACWQRFKDSAQYLPVMYGQPCPEIPADHQVYIVDFSYDAETLVRLHHHHVAHGGDVTVIDHHASAQRDLISLSRTKRPGLTILFNMQESGATLTWKYLRMGGWAPQYDPEQDGLEYSMPIFFKYVRDRDLWRWALPDSKAISMAYWALDKAMPSI